jgi:hypothetical protein
MSPSKLLAQRVTSRQLLSLRFPQIPGLTTTEKHGILQKMALNFLSLKVL